MEEPHDVVEQLRRNAQLARDISQSRALVSIPGVSGVSAVRDTFDKTTTSTARLSMMTSDTRDRTEMSPNAASASVISQLDGAGDEGSGEYQGDGPRDMNRDDKDPADFGVDEIERCEGLLLEISATLRTASHSPKKKIRIAKEKLKFVCRCADDSIIISYLSSALLVTLEMMSERHPFFDTSTDLRLQHVGRRRSAEKIITDFIIQVYQLWDWINGEDAEPSHLHFLFPATMKRDPFMGYYAMDDNTTEFPPMSPCDPLHLFFVQRRIELAKEVDAQQTAAPHDLDLTHVFGPMYGDPTVAYNQIDTYHRQLSSYSTLDRSGLKAGTFLTCTCPSFCLLQGKVSRLLKQAVAMREKGYSCTDEEFGARGSPPSCSFSTAC
ncbi:uncharacterized protein RCC_12220 [Ramularia collo-cygni]|uniref:Uncharacterized protein n=1 Tax=Ramularia collo-cygni TaxID=112498 RepID=A0A2D3VB98_9PEZI|nr:uncharacterized protein RCC_12220 [Ramularia collo-cygni]CZT22067.1 uncharacterized protein RCC_12220 [Ramularia collo-cygni]